MRNITISFRGVEGDSISEYQIDGYDDLCKIFARDYGLMLERDFGDYIDRYGETIDVMGESYNAFDVLLAMGSQLYNDHLSDYICDIADIVMSCLSIGLSCRIGRFEVEER